MASVRGLTPKITWGSGYANTLTFAYALDTAVAGSVPREGSETVQLVSGVEDASWAGDDETLRARVRWVPGEDTVSPAATGWDGATGWGAFLRWARPKRALRFYPDASAGTYYPCYLVAPTDLPEPEKNGWRTFELVLRTTDGTPFVGY